MKLELIATATFGIEAVVRREIEALGFSVTKREDGRITYITNEAGLVRSNLWLRCADRVLLKMGDFKALSFEDLFQGMRGIAWETLIPQDGNFIINCSSVKSKLSSVPACQSVAEKALISRLSETYGEQRFSKQGAKFNILIRILKDEVTVSVDTSGQGLHKRGYRTRTVTAPIKETLAAAIVSLSFWKAGRILADPFCGSGTIAIEAALIGRNIAPGINRSFAAENWDFVPEAIWKQERANAYKQINLSEDIKIFASDISRDAVSATRENAENAGVDDCISIEQKSFASASVSLGKDVSGVMVTNPPYGERLGDIEKAEDLYRDIGAFFKANPSWSLFLITTHKQFEDIGFNKPADRRRKLYNGRLETTLYQYHGEKL